MRWLHGRCVVDVVVTECKRCLMGQVATLHNLTRAVMVVVTTVGEVTVVAECPENHAEPH